MDKVKKPAVVETTEYEVPEIGEVVYFLRHVSEKEMLSGFNVECRTFEVDVGIVADVFGHEACIQLLKLDPHIKVDGVPIEDIIFPTEWKKLPAGWSSVNDLISIATDTGRYINIENKEDILNSYLNGDLKNAGNVMDGTFSIQIDPNEGYRVFFVSEYTPNMTRIRLDKIYSSFPEAAEALFLYNQSIKKQSEMSDLEFSVEKIKKIVNEYVGMKYKDAPIREKLSERYLKFFNELKSLETVEARNKMSYIEWKHKDKKRWNKIDPDEIEVI